MRLDIGSLEVIREINKRGKSQGINYTRTAWAKWMTGTIPRPEARRLLGDVLEIPHATLAKVAGRQERDKFSVTEPPEEAESSVPYADASRIAARAEPGDGDVIRQCAEECPPVHGESDGEFGSIPVQTANGVIAYLITRRALLSTLAIAMPRLEMPQYVPVSVAPMSLRFTDVADLLSSSVDAPKSRAVERGSFLTVTRLLASQRQAVAPDALLSLVEAHRDSLAMLFRRAGKDPVRADIGALLGETSIVASRLWSAMGNRSLAVANCAFARQLADGLDNPVLGATARIFESNLQSGAATLIGAEGDVVVGLRMLTEAASVDHLLSPAARARIAAEQAQAYAVLQLGREAQEALDRARREAETIDDSDRTGLFSDWTPSRLLVYEGTCWLLLGEAKRAVEKLSQALCASEADSSNVNVLLAARVDLASAYAVSGELGEGCRLLGETYARLTTIGNDRGIQRALRARERLSAWKDEPVVRELDEQFTGDDRH